MAAIDYISSLTFNNTSLKRILNTGDTSAKIFGPAAPHKGFSGKKTDSQKIQALNRHVFSVAHFIDSELSSLKARKESPSSFQDGADLKLPPKNMSRRPEDNEPGRTTSLQDRTYIMAKHDRLVSQTMESMRKSLGISGTIETNATQIRVSEMDSLLMIAKNVNNADTGIRASIIAIASREYNLMIEAERETVLSQSIFQTHGGDAPFLTTQLPGQYQVITSQEHIQSRSFPSAGKPLALTTGAAGAVHTIQLLGTNMEWTDIAVHLKEDSLISLTGKINSAIIQGVAAAVEMTPGEATISYSLRLFGVSETAIAGSRELLKVMSFSNKSATTSGGIFAIDQGNDSVSDPPSVFVMVAATNPERSGIITLSIPGPENGALIESYKTFSDIDNEFPGGLYLPTILKDISSLMVQMKFVKSQASITEFMDNLKRLGDLTASPASTDRRTPLQNLPIPREVFAAKYTMEKIIVTDIVLADTGGIPFTVLDNVLPESAYPRSISVPVFLPEATTDKGIPAYHLAISILRAEETSVHFGGTQTSPRGASLPDTPETAPGNIALPEFSFSQDMLRDRLTFSEVRATAIGLHESQQRYNLLAGITDGTGNEGGSGSITGNEQPQAASGRIIVNTNPERVSPASNPAHGAIGFSQGLPGQALLPGTMHIDEIHRLVQKMAILIDLTNATFHALGETDSTDITGHAQQSSGAPAHKGIILAQENLNTIFYDLAEDLKDLRTSALLGLTISNGKRISLDTAILEKSLSGNSEETVNAMKNFGHTLFERLHFYFDPASGAMIHFKKIANEALQTPGQLDDDLNQELVKQKEDLEKRLRTVDYLISSTTERIEWLKPLARIFPETSPPEEEFVDASLEPDNG